MTREYSTVRQLWLWLAALAAVALFSGELAEAQVADRAFKRTAAQLSALTPTETNQRRFYVCSDCLDASSCTVGGGTTENLCKWDGSAWEVVGGAGGSGDITQVWNDTAGDVSALIAAAGDSLDAASADAASPCTRSSSLPGTCTEGQCHQDTDSGGTETYVCTATNTWTKFVSPLDDDDDPESINPVAADFLTGIADDQVIVGISANDGAFKTVPDCDNGKLLYDTATNAFSCGVDATGFGGGGQGEYDPLNYPISGDVLMADEFSNNTPSLTWTTQNLDSATVVYVLDGAYVTAAGTTDQWHGQTTPAPAEQSADYYVVARVTTRLLREGTRGCGISVITGGTAASPTEINTVYLRASTSLLAAIEHIDHDDYDFTGTNVIGAGGTVAVSVTTEDMAQLESMSVFVGFQWIDATDDLRATFSWDGRNWLPFTTDTTTDGQPVALGLFSRDDTNCYVEFFRVLDTDIDADGTVVLRIGS